MSHIVLLDSGPLSLLSNPKANDTAQALAEWAVSLISSDITLAVSSVIDYEVRRQLLLNQATKGIQRFDELINGFQYVPVTIEHWRLAASFWATLRRQGKPGAAPENIDVDVILAAQAKSLEQPLYQVVVATTNIKHFAQICQAKQWQDISPESFS